MNYKALIKILLIGFIIFAIAVSLGIKFNWGQYIQPKASETSVNSAKLADQSDQQETIQENSQSGIQSNNQTKSSTRASENIELIDENNIGDSSEEQIRNDCIRASRRAGVTDENILAVVNECVEMSTRNVTDSATHEGGGLPVETVEVPEEQPTEVLDIEDSLALTRKACKIVADGEEGLSTEERLKVIEQCVKANMDSQ